MPGGDGTGPLGEGPMTGRRAGFCAGYPVPGYANPWPRLGLGRGFWRGRGIRAFRRFPLRVPVYGPIYGPIYGPEPADEKTYLENTIKYLERELENARKRLQELEEQK
ncbi:MAG: hypothetical protein DRO90_02100 [Candidatus Altiarchaeales archaeon]|nr:MAG: hypothetical protein DRO95_05890 [Candidatus Altiarchaeales archaeon]RLI93672.1 MAG: hypothetical protein DRO94_04645 [Candidatus Altiarchaeales archaeon]RLI94408.1 MAG: hypothetical protein DRO90_02100 [Candidatus Altiarchaeales archaeon]HDO81967.1 hypothetical protein [Candidatus Altiarchaeales archaeon]HEX54616.1 hypothetical protein [Candidatus Altiarchaeales archaeon]